MPRTGLLPMTACLFSWCQDRSGTPPEPPAPMHPTHNAASVSMSPPLPMPPCWPVPCSQVPSLCKQLLPCQLQTRLFLEKGQMSGGEGALPLCCVPFVQ